MVSGLAQDPWREVYPLMFHVRRAGNATAHPFFDKPLIYPSECKNLLFPIVEGCVYTP